MSDKFMMSITLWPKGKRLSAEEYVDLPNYLYSQDQALKFVEDVLFEFHTEETLSPIQRDALDRVRVVPEWAQVEKWADELFPNCTVLRSRHDVVRRVSQTVIIEVTGRLAR